MKIEATWEVKPKSGITHIELSDLDCKTKKQWDNLSEDEQRIRINRYLMESDYPQLKPLTIEWG